MFSSNSETIINGTEIKFDYMSNIDSGVKNKQTEIKVVFLLSRVYTPQIVPFKFDEGQMKTFGGIRRVSSIDNRKLLAISAYCLVLNIKKIKSKPLNKKIYRLHKT